jgi:hypothetical protein
MHDPVVQSLLLDLLEWLALRDRTYDEVMAAWRTSCPHLPAWKEANDRALVLQQEVSGRSVVRITPAGLALLHTLRRPAPNHFSNR